MPTFGTPTYGGSASGNTLNLPRPVDRVDGCKVVLAARSSDSATAVDWTPPPGFVRQSAAAGTLPNAGVRVGAIWTKDVVTAANEPATYTLTGPTGRSVGIAVKYIPDEPGAMTMVGAPQYGGNGSTSGIASVNARTLSAAPALSLLALGAECTAGISHVPSSIPAGYTTIGNAQHTYPSTPDTSGTRTAIWLGYLAEPDTSVDAVTGGFSGASASGAYGASLKGGLNVVVPVGLPVKLGDGSIAYLSYLDGSGVRRAPASRRMTQPPFLVADSLAKPGVTMGHRGASAVAGQPEMSRRAYRYTATQRNYRMLEFSCNRTSDGVYVGCHDADINRVAQQTGLANLSAMTWAQVQAYMNSLNSAGTPVPFYRLDDFLDEFAAEATVHVDPKFNTGGTAAFLNVLDAHGGPSRVVVKYVGTGSGAMAIADAAKLRGYKTACYFYETDWSAGKIDAEQSHWDILGMEYTASVDAWARTTTGAYPGIRSYGKPVLAHIIPSLAGYNLAKSKIEEGGWVDPSAGRSWIAQISRPDLVAPVW